MIKVEDVSADMPLTRNLSFSWRCPYCNSVRFHKFFLKGNSEERGSAKVICEPNIFGKGGCGREYNVRWNITADVQVDI